VVCDEPLNHYLRSSSLSNENYSMIYPQAIRCIVYDILLSDALPSSQALPSLIMAVCENPLQTQRLKLKTKTLDTTLIVFV